MQKRNCGKKESIGAKDRAGLRPKFGFLPKSWAVGLRPLSYETRDFGQSGASAAFGRFGRAAY